MFFGIAIILFLGWIIFSASRNNPSCERPIRVTPEDIRLDSVREAVMEKLGWNSERAKSAQQEYFRFLTLLQLKPGFMLVPWPNAEGQDDLDQFWHQHILDTAKYAADCDRLFGRMIHHNPHVVIGSSEEHNAVEKTQRLYARTFAENPYGQPMDAAFVASCGSCGTVDSGSSHGDGGHSGGHGDSGHGCGGHSCGHGCGGHGCGGH
jgi:hypothetical protein